MLPASLKLGEDYMPKKIDATQHFTQPPPRYSEATLVKELEKKGIGRPSTYATIISTIQDRGYVTLESRRFTATELGEIVTDQLVSHFGDVINTDFTSSMEADLDRVESGELKWGKVVKAFHDVFAADLVKAETAMKNIKLEPQLSDRLCDKCGAPMAMLYNKRGKFLGCSRYPGVQEHDAGRRPAREVRGRRDRARVPEVRQADGDPHGQAREVPRVHRLSEVQEHRFGRRRRPGDRAQGHGRDLRQVQVADGHQGLASRAVPRLHELPEMPQREALARRVA